MRKIILGILILLTQTLFAEGTRELAPNPEIIVNGRATNDVAAIYVGAEEYGFFAEYDNPNGTRFNVRILDPSIECLFFGFGTAQNGDRYRVHIFDPNDNEIYTSPVFGFGTAPITDWEEAFNGPQQIVGPDGYDALTLSSAELMSAGWIGEGDYYIQFSRIGQQERFYIPLWDVTVADCSTALAVAKPGRVWSEQWALFTPPPTNFDDNFDRPFNGAFYIAAPDPVDPGAAFITRMDFNGSDFRGAAFSVALNSFGASNFGTIEQNRRSVEFENSIIGEYPVFLNDPIDLFRTAEIGELVLLGSDGCLPSSFCIQARTTEPGEIEILLDFEGDNQRYDENSRDVLIPVNVELGDVGNVICIPWNGMDGRGNEYIGQDLDSITIVSSFRQGIYHFPIYDVEINLNGFRLESVRPLGDAPILYYDDRNINFNSNTGSPRINLAGCETPCHTWEGDIRYASYGNLNTINSWWFGQSLGDAQKIALRFSKEVDIARAFCEGGFVNIAGQEITEPGLYTIRTTTWLGCDSVINAQVDEILPEALIQTDQLTLNCDFPSIELNASASIPAAASYFWIGPSDESIENQNAQVIEVSIPGTYTLMVEEAALDCRDEVSIEIGENFSEPEINSVEIPIINCYKDNRMIEVNLVDPNDSYTINWTTSNGSVVAGSDLNELIINDQGTYTIDVELNETGCSISESIDVFQDTTTYNSLNETPDEVYSFCELASLQLEVASPHYDSIRWFGTEGLSCYDCESPNFLTAQDGSWNVILTDTNGCQAYTMIDLVINEDYKIYMPNAFSPNNDGINDVYRIFSAQCPIEVVEFVLFDRWGKKVFERYDFVSTDDIGWNGIFEDKVSDPGVFVYRLLIRTYKDEVVPFDGAVHLMR